MRAIAAALAQAGRLDEALSIARAVDTTFSRADALRRIASALAQAGRDATATFSEALSTARTIDIDAGPFGDSLTDTVRAIAAALAQAGRLDEALSIARAIEDASSRVAALGSVATALAQAGRFDEALSIARAIHDASACAIALGAIAATLTQAGHDATATFDEALSTTRAIEAASSRANALSAIAAALAQTGKFTMAFGEVGLRKLAQYMNILGEWHDGVEKIERGLTIKVLREATRIVAWEKPQWKDIHAILVKATEGG
ncbi:MAG: hypothetical protein KF716_16190 [Anaerolineae bacterium]|nr:hypothetical protein [Anaerolineae bacterium]